MNGLEKDNTSQGKRVCQVYWGSLFEIITVSVDISAVKIVHSSVIEAHINFFKWFIFCISTASPI